jgi:hypothetical protein
MKGSVSVHVNAPPWQVWSLVSDVLNTGRFSPETFEAQWLDGASEPAVGTRFRGHVRRNGSRWLVYWTNCTITKCDPGTAFAFEVKGPARQSTITWSYRFEPSGDGTTVTESFELGKSMGLRLYAIFAGKSRSRTNVINMRETLNRIKVAAESTNDDG